jgi:hypothetical protein
MKTYTMSELDEILRKHRLWLGNDPSGSRADLYGADLSRADLSGANLYGADLSIADLSGANLYGADLSRADLSGANLYGADLSGANLYGANLYGANLSRADLSGANLYGADLYGANLYGANNLNYPIACPEKGSFTAFKKVRNNYIVELEVPANALRSSGSSRKCRCSCAKVVSITAMDGSPAEIDVVYSKYDKDFAYRVGEVVRVDNFDANRWNECAPGIHFFITRQEAVDYDMF